MIHTMFVCDVEDCEDLHFTPRSQISHERASARKAGWVLDTAGAGRPGEMKVYCPTHGYLAREGARRFTTLMA